MIQIAQSLLRAVTPNRKRCDLSKMLDVKIPQTVLHRSRNSIPGTDKPTGVYVFLYNKQIAEAYPAHFVRHKHKHDIPGVEVVWQALEKMYK